MNLPLQFEGFGNNRAEADNKLPEREKVQEHSTYVRSLGGVLLGVAFADMFKRCGYGTFNFSHFEIVVIFIEDILGPVTFIG